MKTYLVTGSTGGIGGAVADLLRERGDRLVLAGRSADRLQARAAELAPAGNGSDGGTDAVATLVVDLAEPRGIASALAGQRLPERVDGLVHSAGALELGTVADTAPDTWIEQLMVNVAGTAELTRVLLPALRTAGGHVVFVNSGAGLRASGGWSAYAASKHGLRALADALRQEEPRLRVTSVYPGRTATAMQRKVRSQEGESYDAAAYADPRTVAAVVVNALDSPPDAAITDVTVR